MNTHSSMLLSCTLQPETPRTILEQVLVRIGRTEVQQESARRSVCVARRLGDDDLDDYITLVEQVAAYSETQGYVGYFRFGWDVVPALIYFEQGRAYLR